MIEELLFIGIMVLLFFAVVQTAILMFLAVIMQGDEKLKEILEKWKNGGNSSSEWRGIDEDFAER